MNEAKQGEDEVFEDDLRWLDEEYVKEKMKRVSLLKKGSDAKPQSKKKATKKTAKKKVTKKPEEPTKPKKQPKTAGPRICSSCREYRSRPGGYDPVLKKCRRCIRKEKQQKLRDKVRGEVKKNIKEINSEIRLIDIPIRIFGAETINILDLIKSASPRNITDFIQHTKISRKTLYRWQKRGGFRDSLTLRIRVAEGLLFCKIRTFDTVEILGDDGIPFRVD